jgi:hypothetical protein
MNWQFLCYHRGKIPAYFILQSKTPWWKKIFKKPSAGRLSADFQQVKKKKLNHHLFSF